MFVFLAPSLLGTRQKKRIFYGQADRKRFCEFFGVFFILDYDSRFSETDFTQEKVNFHVTTGIPNSSSYCCCPPDDHLQEASPSF